MFRPDLVGHLQGDFYNVCSCTQYKSLPEDGLLNQTEMCWRTNQQINSKVQQAGIDSV